MDLTLVNVKQDSYIDEFITETDKKLNAMMYTDHGRRHAGIVSDRSMMVARNVGFNPNEIEYAGIAGYCHDMANFYDRKLYHFWGGLFFFNIFAAKTEDVEGVTMITQAIANHDKDEARLTNNISAALII